MPQMRGYAEWGNLDRVISAHGLQYSEVAAKASIPSFNRFLLMLGVKSIVCLRSMTLAKKNYVLN
jgi:hypothetical protein